MIDVPGLGDGPRHFCPTPGCETYWRHGDHCPTCGPEGVVSHVEPRWWPTMSAKLAAERARR